MLKVWILWVLLITGMQSPMGYITPGWVAMWAYSTFEECDADARARYIETARICVKSPSPDGPISGGGRNRAVDDPITQTSF